MQITSFREKKLEKVAINDALPFEADYMMATAVLLIFHFILVYFYHCRMSGLRWIKFGKSVGKPLMLQVHFRS